jgi:hypothetical protein
LILIFYFFGCNTSKYAHYTVLLQHEIK